MISYIRGENMAKRKKLPSVPDYLGTSSNQQVQKSNPLQSLSETPLTLSELKILDVYLSRINSHNPDKRYVRFEKGELEKLLGVTRILKDDLEKRLDNLFVAVTIRDENKPKNFTKIGLFEKAEATQDDDGLWQVNLACTGSAMEYVFNIENLGYLRYRLKNIIDLTSRYSYVLYLYLENNRFRKSWEVSIDELRKTLNCTADSYNAYKEFNDKILKKCHKELNNKTTLKYTYEPCKKKGRKYTAIKFTLETKSNITDNHDPNQITLEQWQELQEEYESPYFWAEPLNGEFDEPQLKEILEYLICVPRSKMAMPSGLAVGADIEFMRYHYISQKYAAMNNADSKKKINNRFNYFVKMIKADADID